MVTQAEQLDLSKRLRELMLHHGITVGGLAEIGGVSKSAMEKYLAGPSSPRAITIANICQALGVSPSWLLFGAPETDEVNEAIAFMTAVREGMCALLAEIHDDEELRAKFTSKQDWNMFMSNLPYRHAKLAYGNFSELKDSVGAGEALPIAPESHSRNRKA